MFFCRKCYITLVVMCIAARTLCSRVIDGFGQKSVYVTEYCPKMQYCEEGAHVMCMYYDKNKEMGPRCANSQNVTITPQLASKLLEISNAIRSKIALGNEKGKDGIRLPKAYGMFRLQWDEELATFAQVLTNQCVLRHDICRATKKFPDPGQTAGLVRYTYPDWLPISKNFRGEDVDITIPGLNEVKLGYAVKQTTKSWYDQKEYVTPEMITNYPDWLQNPAKRAGKLYMEMIASSATHMGCGMSAYSEYTYRDNYAAMNYNSIQVVCNFSARPRRGQEVYNTDPPNNPPPGTTCGCPDGYEEDEDCLCNESENVKPVPKPNARSCSGKNCAPTVVLLPIIALEDAPPHKLCGNRCKNSTVEENSFVNILSNAKRKNDMAEEVYSQSDFDKMLNEARSHLQQARSPSKRKYQSNVQNRYFTKTPMIPQNRFQSESLQRGPNHVRHAVRQLSRKSIFSKADKFELPPKKKNDDILNQIKRDVPPRKNFLSVQKLVNSYLNTKRSYDDIATFKDLQQENNKDKQSLMNFTTDIDIKKTQQKIDDFDKYLTEQFHYNNLNNNSLSNLEIRNSNDDNDKKIMYLLDNLEQEVQRINLDEKEKEVLDAKLRKIYERIINNSPSLRKSKKLTDIDYERIENTVTYDHPDLNFKRHLVNNVRNTGRITENLGSFNFKKRLEKPINENIDYINTDQYSKKLFPRNQNALAVYENAEKVRDVYSNGRYNENLNRHKFIKDNKSYRDYTDTMQRNLYEDVLSYERKKYYQDKIANLERKLYIARKSKPESKPNIDRQLPPILPNRQELELRPSASKASGSEVYMPDRARSVHGF